MVAYSKILTGVAGLAAAFAFATPAAAQYYPQPGYGGNNPVGQIVGQILGYGRYPHGNYGYNQYGGQSMAIDQCARAIEARLRGYRGGYYGYGNQYGSGYGNQYGNQGYGAGGRVQGITRVERKNYGLKVWGVATSGFRGYEGYGRRDYGNYGYGAGADLRWDCEVRHDGRIRGIDINRRTATWRGY